MNVEAKTSDEGLRRLFGRLPSIVESELAQAQERMAKEHIRTMTNRMTGRGEGLVKTRTGFLENRFTSETRRLGGIGGVRTRVFVAGVKYADIQERGGTIRPKNKKFLTVPMDAIKTAGGAIKGQYSGGAGEYRKTGKSFIWKNALGGAFIAEKLENGKGLRLLWKLVRQVRIPGNLGWYATWRKAEPRRRDILSDAAKRIVERLRAS